MAKRKNKKNAVPLTVIIIIALVLFAVSAIMDKKGMWDKIAADTGIAPNSSSIASPTGGLNAYFIDVGQGDCSLFVSDGKTMLIDCGEKNQSSKVISTISGMGITTLDYVVATHAHSDHIGGMADVINAFTVGNIIMSEPGDSAMTSSVYENFLDAADESNANIISASPGNKYTLGDASFEIIAPYNVDLNNENNNSVVLYITYSDTSFLLTGDAEKEEEARILESYPLLKSDILKAGHHGSKTSTSKNFLNAVSPECAVISVGENNKYNHPSEETINKFNSAGIKYYRTDKNGTITVTCSGDTYTVTTEK